MKELIVEIKFITPGFIGGAEKSNKGEFRLSSFKSLLRYWWRAICSDNLNINEMKNKEEKIFGGQGNSSSFDLQIVSEELGNYKQNSNILNDKSYIGIRYLFFSIFQQDENIINQNRYIPPESKFKLRFIFKERKNVKDNKERENVKENIIEVLKALWAFENFGGIGARSRRGAGSFKVTKIEYINIDQNDINDIKNNTPKFLYEMEKVKEFNLETFINNNLTIINNNPPNSLQEFTRRSNNNFIYKIILEINRNNNRNTYFRYWHEILNYIGNQYKEFRNYKKTRFRNESIALHKLLIDNIPPSNIRIKRISFGLPINFKFRRPDNFHELPKEIYNHILKNVLNSKNLSEEVKNLLKTDLNNYFKLNHQLNKIDKKNFEKIVNDALTLIAKPKKFNDLEFDRRASPMFIKIGEIEYGNIRNYYILITLIWSKFLKDSMRIEISNKIPRNYTFNSSEARIDDIIEFLDTLR